MKIIFFRPHTAIWAHSFPEAVLAEDLQNSGHEIVSVTCNKIYSEYCTSMSAYGLDQTISAKIKADVCRACLDRKALLNLRFRFKELTIETNVTEDERQIIENTLNLSNEDLLNFSLNGVEIGRLSLYEILLQQKKSDLNFTAQEWGWYRTAFRNGMLTHYAALHIFEAEKPDRVLVYNSVYVTHHIFAKTCEMLGAPFYFLHAGENISNRLSTLIVSKHYTVNYRKDLIDFWPKFKKNPLTKSEVNYVTGHFNQIFKGAHFLVYSSKSTMKKSIRAHFHLPLTNKIIVATLSSYDERFAAEETGVLQREYALAFKNQIEWVRSLSEYIRDKQDYSLIIRVHPREFPNKRDLIRSEHSLQLQQILSTIPANAVINWPDENISLYDIAKEADLVLNAWSSAGEELCLLGIPVLLFSPNLIFYPPSLNYVGETPTKYFAQLEKALADGWNASHIQQAFRWYNMKFTAGVSTVSKSFHFWENPDTFIGRVRKFFLGKLYHFLGRLISSQRKTWELKARLAREYWSLTRKPNVSSKKLISAMLTKNVQSMLHVKDFYTSEIPVAAETAFIRKKMHALMGKLFDKNDPEEMEKPLFKNLKKFVEGKT